MKFHSIHWKLSLSFAGIALLTTLALGVALLLPLRAYYCEQELTYLRGNAQSIALGLAPLLGQDTQASDELNTHIRFLAFLSQARVRLVDLEGNQIADSGPLVPGNAVQMAAVRVPPDEMVTGLAQNMDGGMTGDLIVRIQGDGDSSVAMGGGESFFRPVPGFNTKIESAEEGKIVQGPAEPAQTVPEGLRFFYSERLAPGVQVKPPEGSITRADKTLISVVPVSNTMFGFELFSSEDEIMARSGQIFRLPVTDAAGQLMGWVELSEGPSYGFEIVNDVARGWALASLVAVIVAATVGWWISRRMSAPVTALTGVTRRMARGDLSVRASFSQQDEYGVLGRAFNEMAGRVEMTVSTLRHFASDAAHELHTPLTALRTNLELAQSSADPREYLARAAEQVARLEHLTRELLDLSRIEGGAPDPEVVRLDLSRLVALICEPFAAQAEQAGIDFRLDVPPDPVWVVGQEGRLTQAVANLVENALKFTAPGGWVAVGVAAAGPLTGAEEGRVALWVEDSGIGIHADDLPALFQRFHRGRNAAGYPGSGLGLSIVKAVADAHGGTVRAESVPGRTRFTVELPEAG